MDESLLYVPEGPDGSAIAASLHSSKQYAAFRYADSKFLLAAVSGHQHGDRLFLAGSKPLVTAYSWGKESPDQRMPVPEPLTCMALCNHPAAAEENLQNVTNYRTPWLLAGGSASGRLYLWELSSGNLVCVKEAHYQAINVLEFSECGTFLVTGGADARVLVWRVLDLVANTDSENRHAAALRTFMDHTLGVTGICVSVGLRSDVRLYSASEDGTVRNYDITTGALLTTFVLPAAVSCIALDPAGRACYAGLPDGTIRTLSNYSVNPNTHILEAVGGNGRIVTVSGDPELQESFVHHQPHLLTRMVVSLDGNSVVSADISGRVMVADAATRQVVKAFPPASTSIIHLALEPFSGTRQEDRAEKKHRLIPQLKRVLVDTDVAKHSISMEIGGPVEYGKDFDAWLQQKAAEAVEMREVEEKAPEKSGSEPASDAEKLAKLTNAYTELRNKHELLLRQMGG